MPLKYKMDVLEALKASRVQHHKDPQGGAVQPIYTAKIKNRRAAFVVKH